MSGLRCAAASNAVYDACFSAGRRCLFRLCRLNLMGVCKCGKLRRVLVPAAQAGHDFAVIKIAFFRRISADGAVLFCSVPAADAGF